jgi:hypothetical protein
VTNEISSTATDEIVWCTALWRYDIFNQIDLSKNFELKEWNYNRMVARYCCDARDCHRNWCVLSHGPDLYDFYIALPPHREVPKPQMPVSAKPSNSKSANHCPYRRIRSTRQPSHSGTNPDVASPTHAMISGAPVPSTSVPTDHIVMTQPPTPDSPHLASFSQVPPLPRRPLRREYAFILPSSPLLYQASTPIMASDASDDDECNDSPPPIFDLAAASTSLLAALHRSSADQYYFKSTGLCQTVTVILSSTPKPNFLTYGRSNYSNSVVRILIQTGFDSVQGVLTTDL